MTGDRDRGAGRLEVPAELAVEVDRLAGSWRTNEALPRLWEGDAGLWTGADESRWLGWLEVGGSGAALRAVDEIVSRVAELAPRDVVLLGMGGSSLGAEMLAECLPPVPGAATLRVVDSTSPPTVQAVLDAIDPERALVISSSKSGGTLETRLLTRIFEQRVDERRFLAITDPGSELAARAQRRGYVATVLGDPRIGGRFSVLSPFGLVPARLAGRDVEPVLDGAREMAQRCLDTEPSDNPGCLLGLVLAAAARSGRRKLGFRVAPGGQAFGAWLEQLLAESLGKRGRGLVPVVAWPRGAVDVLELEIGASLPPEQLGAAGLRTAVGDARQLGAEIFRWQFATAVCGAVLGVHPFDQPDVEAAKQAARHLTEAMQRRRGDSAGPFEGPPFETSVRSGGIRLLRPAVEGAAIGGGRAPGLRGDGGEDALTQQVERWLARVPADGYLGVLDYLPGRGAAARAGGELAQRFATRYERAAAWGRGPRYLHSTGQAFKGGPALGHFLLLVDGWRGEMRVPATSEVCAGLLLGDVQRAQAAGDAVALAERGRPVLVLEVSSSDPAALTRVQSLLA
ncbi:MAG: hypothetical protein DWQ36_22940 [Acidobacteria bacterium]|nr:MAG: hypothetical protein DWQ30_21385 [Acidobacteriota bacterium]REK00491.1 MAG: hypothetical protein DWQ36_22940 [Acidobacteriota bacterium]